MFHHLVTDNDGVMTSGTCLMKCLMMKCDRASSNSKEQEGLRKTMDKEQPNYFFLTD